ncbi:MAG: 2-amino-4-hydroxy-6-hydroxymethyldihydropteridine diphosphokinase [Gammaproteobacteria bacterium]|jgi:2-amino-4-hydroxy-6-hydroxymethyldihydropteridine diphosphokinase|nr:2-amino-4-hydroxy-6-hydroxymethyldihydropteridine diphosphokinase [Gammaproteobacteria bacterium]
MDEVFLGLGSNQEPKRHLAAGIVALQHRFGDLRLSPVYRSEAVGFSGSDFLNAAARIRTELSVAELKDWLTDLENRHGRDRSQPKFSDRSLDIDILLHGDRVGTFDGLQLPRGEILEYAHVLKPLADIAPDLHHPVTGLTMAEHWRRFDGDRSLSPLG